MPPNPLAKTCRLTYEDEAKIKIICEEHLRGEHSLDSYKLANKILAILKGEKNEK